MTKPKPETVQKASDGWAFMHPTTNEWTGQFKTRHEARAARAAVTKGSGTKKKVVDTASETRLDSRSHETTSIESTSTINPASENKEPIMHVTFTKSTKNRKSTSVVYNASNGLRGSARFAKTFFKDGIAPETLVIDGASFAEPKAKLTAEERKTARKNAPKLSAAQKLAKLNERAAKLQAKINAENAAAPQSM